MGGSRPPPPCLPPTSYLARARTTPTGIVACTCTTPTHHTPANPPTLHSLPADQQRVVTPHPGDPDGQVQLPLAGRVRKPLPHQGPQARPRALALPVPRALQPTRPVAPPGRALGPGGDGPRSASRGVVPTQHRPQSLWALMTPRARPPPGLVLHAPPGPPWSHPRGPKLQVPCQGAWALSSLSSLEPHWVAAVAANGLVQPS